MCQMQIFVKTYRLALNETLYNLGHTRDLGWWMSWDGGGSQESIAVTLVEILSSQDVEPKVPTS